MKAWSNWEDGESCQHQCRGTYEKYRTCRDPNDGNATVTDANCGSEPAIAYGFDCPVNEVCWEIIQSRGQFGNDPAYFYRSWDEYVTEFGVRG